MISDSSKPYPARRLNEWDYLIIADPRLAAERIKTYCTTMGVVSALIAIIGVQLFLAPAKDLDTSSDVGVTYAVFSGMSVTMCLLAVLLSTVVYCQVNMLTKTEDVFWLLMLLSRLYLYDICTYSLVGGCVFIAIALSIAAFAIYSRVVGIVFTCSTGVLGILIIVCFLVLDEKVRVRLKQSHANIPETIATTEM